MTLDTRMLFVFASVGAIAMCGGTAVIDAETSQGGSGTGTGSGTGGASNGSSNSGSTGTGINGACVDDRSGEARGDDCQAACEILFCCAERECNGIDPAAKDGFVLDCVDVCETQPAIVAVVNGQECGVTVATVRAANAEFSTGCDARN